MYLVNNLLLTRLKSHGVPGVRKVKEFPLCSGGLQGNKKMEKCMCNAIYFALLLNKCQTLHLCSPEKHKMNVKAMLQVNSTLREQ